MTNKEIGEHVAAFMKRRGWDDKQMAKYCEVMPCQVRKVAAGLGCETVALARIARKVGLEVPGLTVEGKRKRPPRKASPNWLRDLVIANGHAWPELAAKVGLKDSGELHGVGVTKPIQPRMLAAFGEFTGLSHNRLLELSLGLCRTAAGLTAYRNRYAKVYGRYPDVVVTRPKARGKAAEKTGPKIPATIAGIEQEMDRLREEAPADETPEQKAARIEHLDMLWRARRDLRAKQAGNAV